MRNAARLIPVKFGISIVARLVPAVFFFCDSTLCTNLSKQRHCLNSRILNRKRISVAAPLQNRAAIADPPIKTPPFAVLMVSLYTSVAVAVAAAAAAAVSSTRRRRVTDSLIRALNLGKAPTRFFPGAQLRTPGSTMIYGGTLRGYRPSLFCTVLVISEIRNVINENFTYLLDKIVLPVHHKPLNYS